MSDTDTSGPTWDAVNLRGIAAHAVDRAERAEAEARDLRATEAVLRGEIRRMESALATFDVVVSERDSLMRATWSAYVETGADTDGDNKWHCSPGMAGRTLLLAVRELAKDCYDLIQEAEGAR